MGVHARVCTCFCMYWRYTCVGVHARVCARFCMYWGHTCVVCGVWCACTWRPEVGIGSHPLSLFHLTPHHRVSQSNPELVNMASLASPLSLGISCSAFLGPKLTWDLCGIPANLNSSPHTGTAWVLVAAEPLFQPLHQILNSFLNSLRT